MARVDHHPPINEEDMNKIYESNVFSLNNPVSLQRKVFFDVMLYFCRRGRENLRKLIKDDFVLDTTANGVEYVENEDVWGRKIGSAG